MDLTAHLRTHFEEGIELRRRMAETLPAQIASAGEALAAAVIERRECLANRYQQLVREMGGTEVKRPPHWGGYVVKPVIVEFWQGRPSRLHDRIQYTLQENGAWKIERLAP